MDFIIWHYEKQIVYKCTCERVTLSSILGHGNKGYGMDALSFDSNSNTFQGLYSRKLLDKDQNEEKKSLKLIA